MRYALFVCFYMNDAKSLKLAQDHPQRASAIKYSKVSTTYFPYNGIGWLAHSRQTTQHNKHQLGERVGRFVRGGKRGLGFIIWERQRDNSPWYLFELAIGHPWHARAKALASTYKHGCGVDPGQRECKRLTSEDSASLTKFGVYPSRHERD